jgi:PKD domain
VNTFARLPLTRPTASRNATRLLIASAAAALTCLVSVWTAAPASAIVKKVGSTTVGLQPVMVGSLHDGPSINGVFNALPESFENPSGHPVLHGSNVFLVYWDPTNHYHADWKAVIDGFVENVNKSENAYSDVFAVDEQYTDKSDEPAYNHLIYRGSYTDTSPYPTAGCTDPGPLEESKRHHIGPITCLTDTQIRTHLTEFIEHNKLPKGMSSVYYLLTPPGVAVCLDAGTETGHCSTFGTKTESYDNSFCSYHSDINPGGLETGDTNTILYGVIPWTAGGAGDGQLAANDQTEAPECQDGGFNAGEREAYEEPPEARDTEEQEAFEELKAKEKEKEETTRALKGPHDEEPNQKPCPTADGYCDVGLADLIINQLAVEQQDIVTDPLLNSWKDSAGNEVTDECRNFFAPALGGAATANEETGAGTLYNQEIAGGQYYLNESFNLDGERLSFPGVYCQHGISLAPEFNSVSPVGAGEAVGFDGGESLITLNAAVRYSKSGTPESNYAKMKWNFGDGSPEVTGYAPGSPPCETPWLSECAESVYHTYKTPGTYTVTLTVTDVGGNTASASHEVTVTGLPPEPAQTPPSSGSPGSPAVTSTPSVVPTTVGGTSASGALVPVPVASAFVLSHSLKSTLSKGLVVHYQVNEQVAGHFEVLLGQKMAKKLKVHGSLASDLPTGSEPEVVIGTGLVVTLKGGGSTTHVTFTKNATAALRHVKKVALSLRLIVRNAAVDNPATSIVTSAFTLTR